MAIVVVCVHQMRDVADASVAIGEPKSLISRGDKWIVVGGTLAFLLVWWIGLLALSLPDLAASVFVIPAVLLVGFACWPAIRSLGCREIDTIVVKWLRWRRDSLDGFRWLDRAGSCMFAVDWGRIIDTASSECASGEKA